MIHLKTPDPDNAILRVIQTVFPFLDMEYGPWVAGGAARLIAAGEDEIGNSDIDIFFPSKETYDWAVKTIRSNEKTKVPRYGFKADNAHKYSTKIEVIVDQKPYMFQLVCTDYYPTVEALMDSFDFTLCMYVTDGMEMIAEDRAPEAHDHKTLTLHKPPPKPKAARLAKYCAYGFTPGPGVLTQMLAIDLDTFTPTETLEVDEY